MRLFKLTLLIVSVLGISACGDAHYHYDDDAPILRSFNILDSYNTNSEFESGPYAVSPYLSDGVFELFWEVKSAYPYRVELFINDRRSPDFGVLLSSAWCGPGEPCGQYSYQFCRYRANLSMVCELPESLDTNPSQDISTLFNGIPEDLSFVLEVCDEDLIYCEYQSLDVSLE